MVQSSADTLRREAESLIAGATDAGMTVRIAGSMGIAMHCGEASAAMDAAKRRAKDIDVVVRHGDRARLRAWLEARGWGVDRDMLVAMEGERFAFRHAETGLDLDVFVERLQFCHTIELESRWTRHRTTLPIEDLLLQKLQIHELKPADAIDTAIVLSTHDVAAAGDEPSDDGEEIDGGYVAAVLARDWGFHRDATANLERVAGAADGALPIAAAGAARAREGAARLLAAIAAAKKSRGFRMRARVGDRMQWWEDVDEREDTY
jgi:hypothetical protein